MRLELELNTLLQLQAKARCKVSIPAVNSSSSPSLPGTASRASSSIQSILT